jgi:FkbM family methyltransferase
VKLNIVKKNMSSFKIECIENILGRKNNIVLFDIGAHNFLDSIGFKKYLVNSEVYGFEPSSQNYINFYQNAVKNDVNVVNVALSDFNGETKFYNSLSLEGVPWSPSGSLLKPTDLLKKRISFDEEGELVKVVRFDSFCEKMNISKVDVVHMDVQGAEHMVIKGMGNFRPDIIFAETCEYDNYTNSGSLESFDDLMFEYGYRISDRLEYDTLYIKL